MKRYTLITMFFLSGVVSISQIIASSNLRPDECWRGKYLNKSPLVHEHLLILPDDRNKFSEFEKQLKSDMKEYLRFVSKSYGDQLQDEAITSVRLKLTSFNEYGYTVNCVVTGKYRYHTGDYCNDAQYNATYSDKLSLTVRLGSQDHRIFYQLLRETAVKNMIGSICSIS